MSSAVVVAPPFFRKLVRVLPPLRTGPFLVLVHNYHASRMRASHVCRHHVFLSEMSFWFQVHPDAVVPLLQMIAIHLPHEFEPHVPLVVPLLLESLKHPL